jgi:fatty-acyl-CoA synthase/long-chain acyl-CoA synthetase
LNSAAIIAGHATTQPDKVAIDGPGETITYAELDGIVRGIALGLMRNGVGAGDLVAICMRDSGRHVASLIATMRLGAVILPVDWRAAPAEMERMVARFAPRVFLTDDSTLPPLSVPTVDVADLAPTAEPVPPAVLDNAPMTFATTSGTTGEPKVFHITHEAHYARVMQFRDSGVILPTERLLAPVPLAYSAGRELALGLMIQGATFLMMPAMFQPQELIDAARRRNATAILVSPNVTRALLDFVKSGRERVLPSLRLYISATAKADPEERAQLLKLVAPAVADTYGTTGGGLVSVIRSSDADISRTSVGRPVPGIEVEVAREDGSLAATDEIGRIRLRGPGVVTRFLGAAPTGDEGIRDGWYYPGDIGSFDADGYLHLHDRSADLIKRGGILIHAQEIEQVLRTHPAIVDAAVVGAPSPSLGQTVAAFVVARGKPDANTLTAYCREHLAGYKVPAAFHFVAELPRNPNGKVVKAELLKRLAGA